MIPRIIFAIGVSLMCVFSVMTAMMIISGELEFTFMSGCILFLLIFMTSFNSKICYHGDFMKLTDEDRQEIQRLKKEHGYTSKYAALVVEDEKIQRTIEKIKERDEDIAMILEHLVKQTSHAVY